MLSCLWDGAYKRTLAANEKEQWQNGLLPYVRHHITVNKHVLSASLNKTFPFFIVQVIENLKCEILGKETFLFAAAVICFGL